MLSKYWWAIFATSFRSNVIFIMGILELRYCADGFLIPPKSPMISTCFDLELMIKQSHLFVAHLVTIQNTMISSLSMRKLELSFKFSSRSTHGNNKFDGLDCGLLKHIP